MTYKEDSESRAGGVLTNPGWPGGWRRLNRLTERGAGGGESGRGKLPRKNTRQGFLSAPIRGMWLRSTDRIYLSKPCASSKGDTLGPCAEAQLSQVAPLLGDR